MKKTRILPVFFLVLFIPLLLISASAHSGGTDASGGHWNHSTGEYHFHHGQSAHQHPNGVCPYGYEDISGSSSGGSTTQKSNSASGGIEYDIPVNTQVYDDDHHMEDLVFSIIAIVLFSMVILLNVRSYIREIKEQKINEKKRKDREEQQRIEHEKECAEKLVYWKDLYNKKPFREIFFVSEDLALKDDGNPYLKSDPKNGLIVYVNKRGGPYHRNSCIYSKGASVYQMYTAKHYGCHPCKFCHPLNYDFSYRYEYNRLKAEMALAGVRLYISNETLFVEKKD